MNSINENKINISYIDNNNKIQNTLGYSSKSFLDYINYPTIDVSTEDIGLHEKLQDSLEEIIVENEENLFDNLINNMVKYYIDEDNTNELKTDGMKNFLETADELGYINLIKLY